MRAFGDDRIIVNMSVWESIDALAAFVYRSGHAEVMRRRREWFDRMAETYQCLWWIPAGHIPTVAEAEDRLAHLRAHGPTATAFTFQRPLPSQDGAPGTLRVDECWNCSTA